MPIEVIHRERCVVDGSQRLRHLHRFPEFPVFMGCTADRPEDDLRHDMHWMICEDCGTIQLSELIPLSVLYAHSHNSGVVGGLWAKHHHAFAEFVLQHSPKTVLEIGGGHGMLSMHCHEKVPDIDWTILEPNPSPRPDCRARYLQGFFDEHFQFDRSVDTVVHSHLLEHLYEPTQFLDQLARILPIGGKHIFSIPNLPVMLERGYTNCINFEHTYFIGVEMLEAMCLRHGLRVIEKQLFLDDHSIFIATERTIRQDVELPQDLSVNQAKYRNYLGINYEQVRKINALISAHSGPVYVFGAHVFTQYLIAFGLDISRVTMILDNDPAKHGRRLTGSMLSVAGPGVLKDVNDALVVLRAGVYNDEVRSDIIDNINPAVRFL